MCGIAGFIDFSGNSSKEILHQMVFSMRHRGPDDSGIKFFEGSNALVGFGQTRLSIIDLSTSGHQPMHFEHLSIVYNGEIYNFDEIKTELINKGRIFRTKTDTEVILQSYDEWGVNCVERFIGMFAFVLFDRRNNKIIAFRDRAGVKPFHYYYLDNLFLFGSELKAIMAHPQFKKEIDEATLPNYFNYGYIAAPYTIFSNTYKLMPGHYLEFDLGNQNLNIFKYWDINKYYVKPKFTSSYQEIKEEVKALMYSSINYRMVADVPVGVFLSGGYDSTAVTAMLQTERSRALKTFTIGFEEGKNEAPYAKLVAQYLGTDHTEYICTTKEAQEIIPTLPFFYDEPFGDSSAIPTILVSKVAKQQVTVALSADAGDEIFCGYQSYFKLNSFLKKLDRIPKELKGDWAKKLAQHLLNNDFASTSKAIYQLASVLDVLSEEDNIKASRLFRYMAEKPKGYVAKIFKNSLLQHPSSFSIRACEFQNPMEVAMCIDFNSYLPNDILTKVDRASMSVSLEGREPLLDHRLAACVAQIPFDYKFDGISGKKILKDIVHDYLPKEMMERPKMGFSLPIYDWLRGDLSYLVDEYLSKQALGKSGLFNVEFLLLEIEKFKCNRLHYSPIIWNLLMFQIWFRKWME